MMTNSATKYLCLTGMLIPVVFFAGMLILAMEIDGYSHAALTVSEIGRNGSPVELEWRLVNGIVSLLFCCFSVSLFYFAKMKSVSKVPAYLLGFFGISTLGYAFFNVSHPLHNLVGMSLLLGYFSPLVLALSWKKNSEMKKIVRWSFYSCLLVIISIILNLSPMFYKEIYTSGYYGLIQRSLFFIFHGLWCGYLSFFIFSQIKNTNYQN